MTTTLQNAPCLRHIIAASLLGMTAAISYAQQTTVPNAVALESEEQVVSRYAVELIVFEYAGSAANTTEIFDPEPAAEPRVAVRSAAPLQGDLPFAIDMPAAGEAGAPFEPQVDEELEEIPSYERAGIVMLDPGEYQLDGIYEKLQRLDAYRPLLHSGWIQSTLAKEESSPLRLRRIGDPPLRLNGTVTLYLGRYLHLAVDLSLERKVAQRMTATRGRLGYDGDKRSRAASNFDPRFITPSTFYRIQEDRIVRNNELRYYDHPKFGVLAKITRIEEAAPNDMDTTDDLLPGPLD